MDPIYEAYQQANEAMYRDSGEAEILQRLVNRLLAYKKKPGHTTLSDVEDTLEATGDRMYGYKFKDSTEGILELLGDRFFGPPPVYNVKWDKQLDVVVKKLQKELR